VAHPNDLYIISKTSGFYHFECHDNLVTTERIENDRFKGIFFDSTRNIIWTYSANKILLYNKNFKPLQIKSKDLTSMGINSIQKILIDNKYSNVFIQEENRLLIFTNIYKPYKALFSNYILNE